MCHMQASLDFLWAINTIPVSLSLFLGVCLFVCLFLIESAFYFFKWRLFPSGILTLHLHFLCVLQEILTGWEWLHPRNAALSLVINPIGVRNNRRHHSATQGCVWERTRCYFYARTLQPTKQPNCSSLFRLRLPSNKLLHVQPKWERPL